MSCHDLQIWLFTGVHSHMFLQMIWSRARVVTLRTFKRLFTSVQSNMILKIGSMWARMIWSRAREVTLRTFKKLFRLNNSVHSHVSSNQLTESKSSHIECSWRVLSPVCALISFLGLSSPSTPAFKVILRAVISEEVWLLETSVMSFVWPPSSDTDLFPLLVSCS